MRKRTATDDDCERVKVWSACVKKQRQIAAPHEYRNTGSGDIRRRSWGPARYCGQTYSGDSAPFLADRPYAWPCWLYPSDEHNCGTKPTGM